MCLNGVWRRQNISSWTRTCGPEHLDQNIWTGTERHRDGDGDRHRDRQVSLCVPQCPPPPSPPGRCGDPGPGSMEGSMTEETRVIYHLEDQDTPYLIRINVPAQRVTLADFKQALNKPNVKFFFKSVDDDFG